MPAARPLQYLSDYPSDLLNQVRELIATNALGSWLLEHYPNPAVVTNDKALYQYVMGLKNAHLKTAPPLGKICFDDKISTLNRSLGLHTYVTRVQGQNLKRKNELRVASLFKETPPQFLRMVVTHELAHLREREHNKAFYQLCCRIEPNYFQYEFGLRLYLTHRDLLAVNASSNTAP
jgi:predicted metal-dependent hydrolase